MSRTLKLKKEKDIIASERKALEVKRRRVIQRTGPAGWHTDVSYIDADNIHGSGGSSDTLAAVVELIEIEQQIKELDEQAVVIDKQIEQIKNIVQSCYFTSQDKVRILRDTIGMTLGEITDELHMSYDRVKHISAKIKKNDTKNDTDKLNKT